jgi:serine/threonine protein kinase
LLKRIGEGAYGEVWLARSVVGSYHGAKIVYRKHFKEDSSYHREFNGICHFEPISHNHPGLLHILHVGMNQESGYYYYLMELADDLEKGPSLDLEHYVPKTLEREIARHGGLSTAACIQLGLSLSEAVAFLHDHGLIHRDIKPGNIVFVQGKPKLADVGLVTGIGEGASQVGTPGFCPPEGPGTPPADIYSMGKVLYEAFTGLKQNQFPDLPSHFNANSDRKAAGLNKIILKACAAEARKRYPSARDLHLALKRLPNDA